MTNVLLLEKRVNLGILLSYCSNVACSSPGWACWRDPKKLKKTVHICLDILYVWLDKAAFKLRHMCTCNVFVIRLRSLADLHLKRKLRLSHFSVQQRKLALTTGTRKDQVSNACSLISEQKIQTGTVSSVGLEAVKGANTVHIHSLFLSCTLVTHPYGVNMLFCFKVTTNFTA